MLVVIVQQQPSSTIPTLTILFWVQFSSGGIYALGKNTIRLKKPLCTWKSSNHALHPVSQKFPQLQRCLGNCSNVHLFKPTAVSMFIFSNPGYDTDLFLDLLVSGGSNALQDDLEGLLQQLPLDGLADQRDGGIPVVAGGRHHQLIVVGSAGEPVHNKGFGLVLLVNRSAGSQLELVNVCFALLTYCLVCFAHLLSCLFSFAHLLSCLFCFAHLLSCLLCTLTVSFVLHTYCLVSLAHLLSCLFHTLIVLFVLLCTLTVLFVLLC